MRIGPLGIWELLIILVVVLLIFGPRRLPEMAKGLGQSVREFRKGIRDIRSDFEEGERADTASTPGERRQDAPAAAPASAPAAASVAGDAANDTDDTTKKKVAADA